MRLRPWGTQDEGGLSKLGCALIQATARIRDGGPAVPGEYRGGTLSATLLALGRGLEGKSPVRSGAAGDLSRAVQLSSPSPTNEIKGGAQSGSLPEAPK